ncbi:MAG TPA: hypothetical protein DCS74_01095 [Veillonellaceae bacterium]|nr:hypothetical protein [Veillonellaceae bacterium]
MAGIAGNVEGRRCVHTEKHPSPLRKQGNTRDWHALFSGESAAVIRSMLRDIPAAEGYQK